MKTNIRTEHLCKEYGACKAVSGLNIDVEPGETYGFIGLNGAGKTTTIRMLLGMIQPTSGTAYIQEKNVHTADASLWNKVGYMVEAPAHYPSLTVRENLDITRKMRLISDKKCIDEVMEKLRISPYADRKAKNLSLGNSQRLGLARALIHRPEILILDEPTNALDPAGIVEIRDLLKDLTTQHGTTVFVSSHILGEVARFATRIGIIHHGQMIREMSRDDLEIHCERTLQIGVHDTEKAIRLLSQHHIHCHSDIPEVIHTHDAHALEHPENLVTLLVHNGIAPFMVNTQKEDLEAYFLRTIHSNTL